MGGVGLWAEDRSLPFDSPVLKHGANTAYGGEAR